MSGYHGRSMSTDVIGAAYGALRDCVPGRDAGRSEINTPLGC